MSDFKYYHKIMALSDTYSSPAGLEAPMFPSLKFWYQTLKIIFRADCEVKLGTYDLYRWVDSSYQIMSALENAGCKFNITGMDNLRKVKGPCVFVANHMSSLETTVLPFIIHPVKPVNFVVKDELGDYPIFGPIVSSINPIRVGRVNPREDLKKVLTEGAKEISAGKSIIIFPTRTRDRYFDVKAFNSMGLKLARMNNVPIIPIALATDAWSMGLVKDIGRIHPDLEVRISFGKSLYIEGKGTEQHESSIAFIKDKFIEWGREDFILE